MAAVPDDTNLVATRADTYGASAGLRRITVARRGRPLRIIAPSIKTRAFAPGQPAFPGKVARTDEVQMRPAGNEAGARSSTLRRDMAAEGFFCLVQPLPVHVAPRCPPVWPEPSGLETGT
jgi:hypothetical protein